MRVKRFLFRNSMASVKWGTMQMSLGCLRTLCSIIEVNLRIIFLWLVIPSNTIKMNGSQVAFSSPASTPHTPPQFSIQWITYNMHSSPVYQTISSPQRQLIIIYNYACDSLVFPQRLVLWGELWTARLGSNLLSYKKTYASIFAYCIPCAYIISRPLMPN